MNKIYLLYFKSFNNIYIFVLDDLFIKTGFYILTSKKLSFPIVSNSLFQQPVFPNIVPGKATLNEQIIYLWVDQTIQHPWP